MKEKKLRAVESSELPTSISEVDRLTLQLANEKSARAESQLMLLRSQIQNLEREVVEAQKLKEQVFGDAKRRYRLGDEDTADIATGVITRHTKAKSA